MRAAFAVLLAAACGAPGDPGAAGTPATVDARAPARGLLEIDPPAAAGAMAPNLAPGADGEAILTWVEPDGSGHRVRLSRLAGMKWRDVATVAKGDRVVASWADTPAAVRAADGSLVASWSESEGGEATELQVGRAGARGDWSRIGPAHDDRSETEHGFASLVPDGGGAIAVWLDGRATTRGEPTMLRAVRVGAGGLAGPVQLDPRVCDCCPTAAAVTDRGPVVVYRDRDDEEVRDISIVRRVGGRWTAPAPVHADGWRVDGCPVDGPAIAARGSALAVAWHTEAGGRPTVRAAFSRDAGASFGAPVEVDAPAGGRSPLGRVAVALDDGGDALVTWVAARRAGAAQILVRRVSAGGGAGPERVVAPTRAARSSGIPRALRVDEWLVVAWSDPEARRLRAQAIALREVGAPGAANAAPAAEAAPPAAPSSGKPAPTGWAGTTADGKAVRLKDLRGKVVVVNLWATWCGPCIAEFPHLVELHRAYAGRGVEFIALSVDEDAARPRVLAAWKKHGLPFALWLDPTETAQVDFAAPSIPVTLVIDRRGMVQFRRDGKITAGDPDLVAAITSSLSAAP